MTHYADELHAAQTAALNEPHLETNPLLDAIFIASRLHMVTFFGSVRLPEL
jgi:hypothetical protein